LKVLHVHADRLVREDEPKIVRADDSGSPSLAVKGGSG
jgi:hypothetical protein